MITDFTTEMIIQLVNKEQLIIVMNTFKQWILVPFVTINFIQTTLVSINMPILTNASTTRQLQTNTVINVVLINTLFKLRKFVKVLEFLNLIVLVTLSRTIIQRRHALYVTLVTTWMEIIIVKVCRRIAKLPMSQGYALNVLTDIIYSPINRITILKFVWRLLTTLPLTVTLLI